MEDSNFKPSATITKLLIELEAMPDGEFKRRLAYRVEMSILAERLDAGRKRLAQGAGDAATKLEQLACIATSGVSFGQLNDELAVVLSDVAGLAGTIIECGYGWQAPLRKLMRGSSDSH